MLVEIDKKTGRLSTITSLEEDRVVQEMTEVDFIKIFPPSRIVSPRQIRQALTATGLRAPVESAVATGDQDLKDWWNCATQFEENHPMILGMAQQLGVTLDQLASLFTLAASK
jgi:hypothetical protein